MMNFTRISAALLVATALPVAFATTIESHMVLNASGNLSIPKKTVVLSEKGGKGTTTAKAHTMHGGADVEHKADFDKKAGEISNAMFDGKPFAAGQTFP